MMQLQLGLQCDVCGVVGLVNELQDYDSLSVILEPEPIPRSPLVRPHPVSN